MTWVSQAQLNTSALDTYVQDLQYCYSHQAELFWHTRKRERPETKYCVEYIKKQLEAFEWEQFLIIDLGCGTWRLAPVLTALDERIVYVGVDNAQGMIEVAQREYGSERASFICEDMINYVEWTQMESVQCVISYAAVQHLMTNTARQHLFLWLYKILDWSGQILIVNWSFSERFIKSYRKHIATASIKASFSQLLRNDLFIPRKWDWAAGTIKRFYHIFLPSELVRLTKNASFACVSCTYILQDWTSSSTDRKRSRNTLLRWVKNINGEEH